MNNNNNICDLHSSFRKCRAITGSSSPTASDNFYYLGYQYDSGAGTLNWAVFQYVDLSLLDWNDGTCNFVLSWPSTGFENKNNGTVTMTWFNASIPDSATFDVVTYNIAMNYSSWATLPSYVAQSSFGSGITPLSQSVTLTDNDHTNRTYVVVLSRAGSSLGNDYGKKWVCGGACYQPTITVSDTNNIEITGSHLLNKTTYNIGHNNYGSGNDARGTFKNLQRQIGSNIPTVVSLTFNDTLPNTINVDTLTTATSVVYTALVQLTGLTSANVTSTQFTLTEAPTLSVLYNGTTYTGNQTFSVTKNSRVEFQVTVHGIEYERDYRFKASVNGGEVETYGNNTPITISSITETQTYVLTPYIDNVEGVAITIVFQVPTDPVNTLTIEKNSTGYATAKVTYDVNTGGTFAGKAVIGTKTIGYTNLRTVTSGSGTFTFTAADLCTTNEVIADATTFIFYIKFTPTGQLTGTEKNISFLYAKTNPSYYNQYGDSNINNTSKICRRVRGIVPKSTSNGLSEATWTWSANSSKGSLSTPSVSSNTNNFKLDTSFSTLPTSNSSVDVNFVATLVQTNSQSKTLTYTYTYTVTAQEIPYPTTLSTILLNPSTLNYFDATDSTAISFTKPDSISSENFFTLPAAWVLKRSTTTLTSSSSAYSFTWSTVKSNLTAAANQRYGTKTNFGLTLTFTNQFSESFTFPVNFSINYDAQVASFSISSSSSSITSGSSFTFTASIGRTTYEKLYLDVYFNGSKIQTVTVNEGVSSQNITFTCPAFSGDTALLYVQARHERSNIDNITSNTLTLNGTYHIAPSITFTSATYNSDIKQIAYAYTITDWGTYPGTPTSMTVTLTDGTHTYVVTAPSLSTALPQTITGTADATSWGLSTNTDIWLAIVSVKGSGASADTVESTSNHITLLLGKIPTVSYRPNYVSINNPSPQANATFEVDTLGARTTIVFRSTTHLIEFNPSTGTIDYKPLS